MPIYHFALSNDAGDTEDLGSLFLTTDDEALGFGHDIIREIMQTHEPHHAGSMMIVTAATRSVASLPFALEDIPRQQRHG